MKKEDTREEVPLELSDVDILAIALEAHRRDITLNEMVVIILERAIAAANYEEKKTSSEE